MTTEAEIREDRKRLRAENARLHQTIARLTKIISIIAVFAVAVILGGVLTGILGIRAISRLDTSVNNLEQSNDTLQETIDDLSNGRATISIAARQDRALTGFRVCAKGPTAVDPEKAKDFAEACKGYETLEDAYRTQGVPPPA